MRKKQDENKATEKPLKKKLKSQNNREAGEYLKLFTLYWTKLKLLSCVVATIVN